MVVFQFELFDVPVKQLYSFPNLPQLEVCVVGGGDLGRKATQVSVVDGVPGRETSSD